MASGGGGEARVPCHTSDVQDGRDARCLAFLQNQIDPNQTIERRCQMKAAPLPSFEGLRERWQRQVLADCELRPSHKLVCMAISLHFNRNENGAAWPGFETLAKLSGLDRSTIIRATKAVEGRGHLRINRARKDNGGSLSNRYFALLKDEGVVSPRHQGVASCDPGGGLGDTRGVAWVTPEPLTEPLTEPPIESKREKIFELRSDSPKKEARTANSRKAKTIPMPEGWCPPSRAIPLANSLNVDLQETETRFRDYLASTGKQYVDYDAAFCNFIRNAPKFNGFKNGLSGPRQLQDDKLSVSRAADRLIDATREGKLTFGPRPRLVSDSGESHIRLLPKGRGA
jgi:Helix-turn-helix domain